MGEFPRPDDDRRPAARGAAEAASDAPFSETEGRISGRPAGDPDDPHDLDDPAGPSEEHALRRRNGSAAYPEELNPDDFE